MGNIYDKSEYLIDTKSLLKDKINNLGGSIDNNTTFRNYANQLQTIYDNLPKTSYQEGTEVNLGVTTKGKLDYDNGVVGIGQSSQDGTPTPSTPIAINSVTGNQDVVVSGKNEFIPTLKNIEDNTTEIYKNDTSSLTLADDEYTFVASGSDMYFGQIRSSGNEYQKSSGNKIYVGNATKLSFRITNTDFNKCYFTAFNSSNVSLGYTSVSSNTGTYNIPSGTSYVAVRFGKNNAVSGTTYTTKIIVAYGDEIPAYEPYITPTSYQLSLGDIELCGIGNYKDELIYDVDEDRVYKNENIVGYTFTGEENTFTYANGVYYSNYFSDLVGYFRHSAGLYSNMYIYGGTAQNTTGAYNNGNNKISLNGDSRTIYMRNDDLTSADAWKSWLSTHQTTICLARATPTLTEITNTTLINQVKALYNAHSLNGTTIITSNGDLPLIIKVRGLKGE